MSSKNFIKENFVLLVGLALPILLMVFFMLAVTLPTGMSAPPKYDMVFSTDDYQGNRQMPVSVNLVVKDGTLKAQYTKNPNQQAGYYGWKKLYIYDAETQKVRELSFGLPTDTDQITTMREDIVEATKDLKLDTTLEAPDGYQISYDGYWRGGFMSEIFWGGGHSSEVRLRKGAASHKLMGSDDSTYFYYGSAHFIGWVKQ